jgi:gas vesicle protein
MGAFKKAAKFGLGGLIGSALGLAGGLLAAPASGSETQRKLRERIDSAKIAGVEAQASKERELITRFRAGTDDKTALADAEAESRAKLTANLAGIKTPA